MWRGRRGGGDRPDGHGRVCQAAKNWRISGGHECEIESVMQLERRPSPQLHTRYLILFPEFISESYKVELRNASKKLVLKLDS